MKTPKLLYLPVINASKQIFFRSLHSNYDNSELITNFWTKSKSPFYYPYALISSFYGMEFNDFRKHFEMPSEMFVYSDSGGFQQCTIKNANVNPVTLINWQERNSNVGSILDTPPYEKFGLAGFGGDIYKLWNKSLEQTKANVKIMLDRRVSEKFQLQSVIQGETPVQMMEWYKELEKVAKECGKEFDGYALSPKPASDPYKIVLHALHINDIGTNKPIHFLQATGGNSLITIAYLNQKLSNDITVDSSTFSYGARFGLMFDIYNFESKPHVGRDEKGKEDIHIDCKEMPCFCQVCKHQIGKKIKEFELQDWDWINMHNLWQNINFIRYWDMIASDEDYFRKKLQKEKPDMIDIVDMIDYGLKEGLVKAYDKFKGNIKITEKKYTSQNLMGFAKNGRS